MNERLPYEEQLAQQWNELPLPDENMAWEDMKRRLEENDDKGIIPFWLRGCGLWGLLAVVLLAIGWWLYRQKNQPTKKEETQKVQIVSKQETDLDKNDKSTNKNDSTQVINKQPGEAPNESKPVAGEKNSSDKISGTKQSVPDKHITKEKSEISVTATRGVVDRKTRGKNNSRERITGTKIKAKERNQQAKKDSISISIEPGSIKTGVGTKQAPPKNEPGVLGQDSLHNAGVVKPDSLRGILKDSLKKKNPKNTVKDNPVKKDSSKPKSISFSAGIAIHQLLPIAGQKLTPYNSEGRKGSLADYIPSVYFRMYKDKKWFLQSEFRYGAPQYNREILYQQQHKFDTFGINNTITSTKLKKTFYHQLPVSFNYFVLPNFSVGAGFVWNRFSAAVSERDVVKRTVATGVDTALSLGTILTEIKADSNFSRSYFQAVFETQYKWKRFSLGARYSFGLQPYLKFTLPGGVQQQEKNKSLQVFLRYELWRSKKKKK